ncbi:MAG TPA: hypothetical protein VK766_00580, partial [Cytophagaceae bacterium]|nr:hypothetical protein [Cytophagaceae bacterium]
FFLLLCLVPALVFAQGQDSLAFSNVPNPVTKTKIRYKSIVISLPYRKIRDDGQSPLLYRGPTLQVAAYNERWRKKSITKFEMVLGVGSIQTNKNTVTSVTNAPVLTMEINYHYFRPFMKILKGRGDWYLGGILTNTFDGRYYAFIPNNSFGYEFSNALNPATNFTYNFKNGHLERKYQVGFKLNFALLAQVIRPNYIGMEPSQTYIGDKIRPLDILTHGNTLALPNHFFRINTEIYLDRFNVTNNDKFRIFYGWGIHVTNLPQSNPLYYAYQTIGVVSMLYSEKTKKINRLNKLKYGK